MESVAIGSLSLSLSEKNTGSTVVVALYPQLSQIISQSLCSQGFHGFKAIRKYNFLAHIGIQPDMLMSLRNKTIIIRIILYLFCIKEVHE